MKPSSSLTLIVPYPGLVWIWRWMFSDDHTGAPTFDSLKAGFALHSCGYPSDEQSNRIHLGREIFDHTPKTVSQYVGAKVACADCHINDGTAAYAAPMIDLAEIFPIFNKRAGYEISLQDRIQECFTRSENGHPIPYEGHEMKALSAYMDWLSRHGVKGKAYKGRLFVKIAELAVLPNAQAATESMVLEFLRFFHPFGDQTPTMRVLV